MEVGVGSIWQQVRTENTLEQKTGWNINGVGVQREGWRGGHFRAGPLATVLAALEEEEGLEEGASRDRKSALKS